MGRSIHERVGIKERDGEKHLLKSGRKGERWGEAFIKEREKRREMGRREDREKERDIQTDRNAERNTHYRNVNKTKKKQLKMHFISNCPKAIKALHTNWSYLLLIYRWKLLSKYVESSCFPVNFCSEWNWLRVITAREACLK